MRTIRLVLAAALLTTVLGIAATGSAGADPVDERLVTHIQGGGYLLKQTGGGLLGLQPTLKMSAKLTRTLPWGTEEAVDGEPIVFHIGATYICHAYTNWQGAATCSLPVSLATVQLLLAGKAEASFPGRPIYLQPSNGTVTAIGPDVDPPFFPF